MEPPRPSYYHSLRPFADWFTTGVPVLTYHKLGPRPPNVRLKGLYLSQRLFHRQLAELNTAGFTSLPLHEVCRSQPSQNPGIAITFDDGFSNVLAHGLDALSATRFRATQFLVANLIGKSNVWDTADGEASDLLMDRSQVREWLAAGHVIGSHTLTHPRLTRIPLEQAREEITASKKKLEDLFGVPIEHFCYPYGDCNHAIRELVQAAGYRTGSTTNFGVNDHTTPPMDIRRLTARYASRNLKALWARCLAWLKNPKL